MGHFIVELPDTLQHELESRAQQEGISLNQYLVYTLTQKVTPVYTIQMVSEAEIQQQEKRFRALLKRLGVFTRDEMQDFLNNREIEAPEDAETAELIAQVERKLASSIKS